MKVFEAIKFHSKNGRLNCKKKGVNYHSSKSGQITFNIHKLNNKYLTPAFGGQIIPANYGNAVWRLQLNFNFEKE